MQSDQFGVWLKNLDLLRQLDDTTLLRKQTEIINLFGGFRCVVKRLLSHHHNLTYIQHNKLSTVLYHEDELKNENEDEENESTESEPLKLTSLSTSVLCYVNTFLSVIDLCIVQRICVSLCIKSRMRESYLSPIEMKQWKIIPYLPQYIQWILQTENNYAKLKGIKGMYKVATTYSVESVQRTGIIPHLIKLIDIKHDVDDTDKQIQFSLISTIKSLSKTFPTIRCIMQNNAAEKLCDSLDKLLIEYGMNEKSDYHSKMINNIIYSIQKIADASPIFRDTLLKCEILVIIYKHYKYLKKICLQHFVSLLRILFYRGEPNWSLITNIQDILLMITEMIKAAKNQEKQLVIDLLWIIPDIGKNRDFLPFIIQKDGGLDTVTKILLKTTQIHRVYKPFLLILFNMVKSEKSNDIIASLQSLLKVVNAKNHYDRYTMIEYDMFGFLNETLEIALNHKYLKCIQVCCEIMYNITKDKELMDHITTDVENKSYRWNDQSINTITKHIDLLSNIFGKTVDDELKVDILSIVKRLSLINKYISNEMVTYVVSILFKEQNINYNIHDNDGLKRDIISGCLSIIRKVSKFDNANIVWNSGFLDIDFNKLLTKDKKIKANTIYAILSIVSQIYRTIANEDYSDSMIERILPCLCKLLPYVNDWEVVENILWSFRYFANDKKWAKYILDECIQEIILILQQLSKREKKNIEVIRGAFLVIRIISNHSDAFAAKILSVGFSDIDLHLYLSYSDGRVITNTLQCFKALITKQTASKALKIDENVLCVLLDILDIDYIFEFAESEEQLECIISEEEKLRIELTLDILQILVCHKVCIIKSISVLSDCGYLDKLSNIALYIPKLKPKASELLNKLTASMRFECSSQNT